MACPDGFGPFAGSGSGFGSAPGSGFGSGSYLDANTADVDRAGTTVTHQSIAGLSHSSAVFPGGPGPARLHGGSGSSFGHHQPPQQFSDFSQYPDAVDSAPVDPSLFDQLALASPSAHAWIDCTVYRPGEPGMWPQQQHPLPTHPYSTEYLQEYQTTPMTLGSPALFTIQDDTHLLQGDTHPLQGDTHYAEALASIWNPGSGVAGETPPVLASSQERSSTAGEAASPEKVKRRRGRPRLYEVDDVQVPKRKPGRPLTYAPVPESFGSRSSMTSSTPMSSDSSTMPLWEGSSPARSARRSQPTDESVEQDPDKVAAQAATRRRNKAAATRYRLKTRMAADSVEVEEREASLRRQALLACADRLRGEVNSLKAEVMQHASCDCPHISGYISTGMQNMVSTIAAPPMSSPQPLVSLPVPQQLPAAVSAAAGPGGWPESCPHTHLAGCRWQQGGFVMDTPFLSPYSTAALSSSGVSGQALADGDGYFGVSMSLSNADGGSGG
ncbi:hypothetical protein QBC39DRAFT_369796 [Podospora conica]|nr:hypothetical protein QBC39DRAFT_369796 [Schizothecium conicum]